MCSGTEFFSWAKWDIWGPQRNTSVPSLFKAKPFGDERSGGGLSSLVFSPEVRSVGFQTTEIQL